MYYGINDNQVGRGLNGEVFNTANLMLRIYGPLSQSSRSVPKLSIPGAVGCLSFRPTLSDLKAHRWDAAIDAIGETAPPGWVLSTWHEANLVKGMTASMAVAIQNYVIDRLQLKGSKLPFGNITLTGVSPDWDSPNIQWAGNDVYDWNRNGKIVGHLNFWYNHLRSNQKSGTTPPRNLVPTLICETNTPIDKYRSGWFHDGYNWLAEPPAAMGILQFWLPGGQWSGDIHNASTATIARMNQINAAAPSNTLLVP